MLKCKRLREIQFKKGLALTVVTLLTFKRATFDMWSRWTSNYNRQTTNENRREKWEEETKGDTQKKESEKGSRDYGIQRNQWVSASLSWQRRTNRKIKEVITQRCSEKGNRELRELELGYLKFTSRLGHLMRLRRTSMECWGRWRSGTFGGHTLWQGQ